MALDLKWEEHPKTRKELLLKILESVVEELGSDRDNEVVAAEHDLDWDETMQVAFGTVTSLIEERDKDPEPPDEVSFMAMVFTVGLLSGIRYDAQNDHERKTA